MGKIRVVLFDAGNTLVYPNVEEILRILSRRGFDCAAETFAAAEHHVRFHLDTPEIIAKTDDRSRWFHYFGGILDELGAPRSALDEFYEYHERRNAWDTFPPELPNLLERLSLRYRLGVVSNSNGTVADVLARLNLSSYFEAIVDSSVVGVEKPDPKIFRIALERMRALPDEAVYVGDLYHVDVVGARRAGLRAVLLDPGDLHGDKDCPRIRDLCDLGTLLASPWSGDSPPAPASQAEL